MAEPDVSGRPTRLREVDLATFFAPGRVAAIGASDSEQAPNTAMWRKIRTWAQANGAEAVPVNPGRETVDGVSCYDSVVEVPGEVDLAAILTSNVLEVLPEVIEKKVAFAVVFAAGFAEVGGEGADQQRRLAELVEGNDLHVLGPNTNLNAFELFEDNPGRAIALITQSGHQGRPIFQAQKLGVRLSHWAPVGNEVDLEFADFAGYFARLEETGCIAAYVEGFQDGRSLLLAADAAARRGVPIVAVKVGRTAEGRSMARSHTGHLTGSDAVISAVFRQYGMVRVEGLDELQDISAALARTRPPAGEGVCVYSISGGTGAHMADMVADAGLSLPELGEATQQRLRESIPGYLRVSNPVDSGGGASSREDTGPEILDAILADEAVDLLIVPITGAVPALSEPFAEHLVAASERSDKPIFVVWGSPVGDETAYREILLDSRLPVFRTFRNCVRAARAYFDYHRFRARYRSPFADPRRQPREGYPTAERLLGAGRPLAEHEAKRLLGAYGVDTPAERLVDGPGEAADAAGEIGLPVVMKVASPDIAHKSDQGLVAVGVRSPAEVRDTYRQLVDRAAEAAPGARLDGVLVGEELDGGVETIVGVVHDDLFGPTVLFGLGGVLVEVLEDVTFRVPPFDAAEARRMIQETAGSRLLEGTRGRDPVDVDALVEAVVSVQDLAMDCAGRLDELDINPLLVRPEGAVALDALAVPRDRAASGGPPD